MCFLWRVSNRKGKLKMQKRGRRKAGVFPVGVERGYNLHKYKVEMSVLDMQTEKY